MVWFFVSRHLDSDFAESATVIARLQTKRSETPIDGEWIFDSLTLQVTVPRWREGKWALTGLLRRVVRREDVDAFDFYHVEIYEGRVPERKALRARWRYCPGVTHGAEDLLLFDGTRGTYGEECPTLEEVRTWEH